MKNTLLLQSAVSLAAILAAAGGLAQNVVAPAPAGAGATTIYRQVLPDGQIVYSDKPQKGARIERTVALDPPVRTTAPSPSGAHIQHSAPGRDAGTSVTLRARDEADISFMRAQMLLEEARKQQADGVEPLPGERTANVGGGSRLNEAYWERQKALADNVADAENALRKARAEYDQIR